MGKYHVAASKLRPSAQRSTLPDEAALDRAPQTAVIPTFYPSAPAFELASPIQLGAGLCLDDSG